MPKADLSGADANSLSRLKELLTVAQKAFADETYFHFPPELHDIPKLIDDLQTAAGRKSLMVPFWRRVCAVDEAFPEAKLKSTLIALFERPGDIPAGPVVQNLKLSRSTDVTPEERAAVSLLDRMIDPITRDYDGANPKDRTTLVNDENLKKCARLFRQEMSPELDRVFKASRKLGLEGDEIFNRAAFWEFAYRSLNWRVRYWPALVELFRLGAALQHASLLHGIEQVLDREGGFTTETEIEALRVEQVRLRSNYRSRKSYRANKNSP